MTKRELAQLGRAVAELHREAREEFADEGPSARRMLEIHLAKPWVRGFLSVLISPTGRGLREYLKTSVVKGDGRTWYFPARRWWAAHAERSHPPSGAGCDVRVHYEFLAEDAPSPEFLYANLLSDGRIAVLRRRDFEKECQAWKRLFED